MMTSCSDHRTLPHVAVCPTCNRMRVEARIVRATVDRLFSLDYGLQVFDGETATPNSDKGDPATRSRRVILAALGATDDEVLHIYRLVHDVWEHVGWVRFVYGNDGWDVICDYTMNLEDAMAPVNALADRLGGQI